MTTTSDKPFGSRRHATSVLVNQRAIPTALTKINAASTETT